jgi:DNA topoisomerase-1
MVEGGEKPKMASLLPGMAPDSVTLDTALMLLSLPRTVGKNPENEADITIQNGRFGPYIKCGTESRTIPADESPFTMTLERSIEILKQPRTRGRASNQPKTLKEVGKHPRSGETVSIKSGRYGPYVTDGTVNASLPQGAEPEALTMEQAVELLDARAAKGPSKGRKRAAKAKPAAEPKKKAAAPKKPRAKATKKKAAEE